MRLHFSQPNDLSKLHDELLAANIRPSLVEGLGDDVWLTVPDDANEAAIAAVVAAHDPTPKVQPPSMEDQIAALQSAVLDLALGV